MDGILVLNKPQGFTSHDAVALIRKRFAVKKVGHAGSLDPMATGVLIILVGKYTKSSREFLNEDKEYYATMTLGATSDTGDAWGTLTCSGRGADNTRAEIESVFKKFLGEIDQRPPMYSAVKHKGERLYKLARRGLKVQVEPRKVTIKALQITGVSLPEVSFIVGCSKGTYIRQLCVDIGNVLGCGAHLSRLNRTRSGRFTIEQALGMEELKTMAISDLEKKLVYI